MNIKTRLLIAAALLSSFAAVPVKGDVFTTCGVDLGMAGRTKNWAIFTLGINPTTGQPNKDAKDQFSGTSKAIGDVGAAGGGNVQMSGDSLIQGNLYYHTGGNLDTSGKAKVSGSKFSNAATDSLLNQGAMDAMNASAFAASLATSPQYASISEITLSDNKKITLTATGCTVLSLKNLKLTGSSTLTLSGAVGSAFVINVTNNFMLSGSSKIVLSGGLTAADVLFNVKGRGASVELSGSSQMTGILLAAKRDVHLSGSTMVKGEVIANTVQLSGSAKVTQAVSPARNP